jgi:hypothetical protein
MRWLSLRNGGVSLGVSEKFAGNALHALTLTMSKWFYGFYLDRDLSLRVSVAVLLNAKRKKGN